MVHTPPTGAERAIQAAIAAGLDVCFANPGTTEMPFVAALDTIPGIRAILGLHETVCTGAADGFARMTGRPALVLLHLGPGFANGMANLHNARRAGSPVVVVVGDHATFHRSADAPLAMNIPGAAETVAAWVRSSRSAYDLPADLLDAEAAARQGMVAVLIAPSDVQWEASGPLPMPSMPHRRDLAESVRAEDVDAAAEALRGGRGAIILGGQGLSERGMVAAARIARATGAALFAETFFARMERGGGLPHARRIPYFPDAAAPVMRPHDHVVLAGARDPVGFFGYPDGKSRILAAEQPLSILAPPGPTVVAALEALAASLGAAPYVPTMIKRATPATGPLDADGFCRTVAALQPLDAIIVDEGISSGFSYFDHAAGAPRFSHLCLTGGAIGWGPAAAVGAAMGAPGRRVINLQADGSALYTTPALWTQARENLDVTTVIGANHRYKILDVELARAEVQAGPTARRLASLGEPEIDWVKLAGGYGVPAVSVSTGEALAEALAESIDRPGPFLIQANI